MKTLDYIHLDAVAAGKVVEALQQVISRLSGILYKPSRFPLEH